MQCVRRADCSRCHTNDATDLCVGKDYGVMVKDNLLPKKRKLAQDVTFATDVKRAKQDLESSLLARRPTSVTLKRRSVDVLNDVFASILLREFAIEHLPTLSEDIPEVVNLIITSASVTSYDQIARQLLSLFTKTYLDDGLLLILTEGLNAGAISGDQIPIRVLRCADRCLHSPGHGYRCAAIGFQVARVMSSELLTSSIYFVVLITLCSRRSLYKFSFQG
ncbi:unnamed protein product [Nippostrongylus brasiliensis]|uniref:MIF4G domain-containing protein n=1 Tax=Nippostrongylus brasiliensis TaxID=27835 RepID=A0A0N4YEZ7_NIPBR|nr:unnamed protein product [Nippostrongylus brasiliensis]